MKKTILLCGILCATILLAGCSEKTEKEAYNEALSGCTMSGYVVITHPYYYYGNYICVAKDEARLYKFRRCSRYCERAIDDNRDLTLNNASTQTLDCLKLCTGE